MIDPKELRIGNCVEYEGKPQRIVVIGPENSEVCLDTIEYGVGVVEYNNINPFPITDNWLRDFKFEVVHKLAGQTQKPFIHLKWIDEHWVFEWDGHAPHIGFYKTPIKYVHQLQNLYFALTGEEL